MDWSKYQNRHFSKSIWVIKLSFCQNDPPIGESFWQNTSLVTHICTLWTMSILIFSPVQIITPSIIDIYWMFFLLLMSSGLFCLVCRKCICRKFEGKKNHIEIFHFTDSINQTNHIIPLIPALYFFHTCQMTRHLAWNTTLWCHGHTGKSFSEALIIASTNP